MAIFMERVVDSEPAEVALGVELRSHAVYLHRVSDRLECHRFKPACDFGHKLRCQPPCKIRSRRGGFQVPAVVVAYHLRCHSHEIAVGRPVGFRRVGAVCHGEEDVLHLGGDFLAAGAALRGQFVASGSDDLVREYWRGEYFGEYVKHLAGSCRQSEESGSEIVGR